MHRYLVHDTAACVPTQEFSTCPSAAKGGDLGTFKRGAMVPEFDSTVFNEETPLGSMSCAWCVHGMCGATQKPCRVAESTTPDRLFTFNTQARRHLRTHQDAVWLPPLAGCRAVREERVIHGCADAWGYGRRPRADAVSSGLSTSPVSTRDAERNARRFLSVRLYIIKHTVALKQRSTLAPPLREIQQQNTRETRSLGRAGGRHTISFSFVSAPPRSWRGSRSRLKRTSLA